MRILSDSDFAKVAHYLHAIESNFSKLDELNVKDSNLARAQYYLEQAREELKQDVHDYEYSNF